MNCNLSNSSKNKEYNEYDIKEEWEEQTVEFSKRNLKQENSILKK